MKHFSVMKKKRKVASFIKKGEPKYEGATHSGMDIQILFGKIQKSSYVLVQMDAKGRIYIFLLCYVLESPTSENERRSWAQ